MLTMIYDNDYNFILRTNFTSLFNIESEGVSTYLGGYVPSVDKSKESANDIIHVREEDGPRTTHKERLD